MSACGMISRYSLVMSSRDQPFSASVSGLEIARCVRRVVLEFMLGQIDQTLGSKPIGTSGRVGRPRRDECEQGQYYCRLWSEHDLNAVAANNKNEGLNRLKDSIKQEKD